MRTLLIIIASVLLALPASARIGETPAECLKRYGEFMDVGKDENTVLFSKGDLLIYCSFAEKKCWKIVFMHKTRRDSEIRTPLGDGEIEALLDANAGVGKWNKLAPTENPAKKIWVCSDEKRQAFYSDQDGYLCIFHLTGEAKAKEEEKAKLKDF